MAFTYCYKSDKNMEFIITYIDDDKQEETSSVGATSILDAIQQFYICEGVRNIIKIERTL